MMPTIQLLILPLAADYQIKNINLGVVDHDHSTYSTKLVNKIVASGYFRLKDYSNTFQQGLHAIEQDKMDLILEIPNHFEKDLVKENESTLFIAINAINGVKAGLGGAYIQSIIQNYNQDVRMQWIQFPRFDPQPTIDVTYSNWYNPNMNYQVFMVPGILVMLVTMIGSTFAALNIVREKELGTIEQINVSPIKKTYFILGKLIPFWVLAVTVSAIGFIIARLVYGIIPLGIFLQFMFFCVHLSAGNSRPLGFIIIHLCSNTTNNHFVYHFPLLTMIFNLISGLCTSIESMPAWAQMITRFKPRYLILLK